MDETKYFVENDECGIWKKKKPPVPGWLFLIGYEAKILFA
jgi:hypothetical protein